MVYLILAALVFVVITIRAVRRVQPMPDWMAKADEEVRAAYQPKALGDRLKDRGGEA